MTGSVLAVPLPALSALPGLVTRALAQSASLPPVTVPGGLTVTLVSDGPRFGLRLAGARRRRW